MSNSNSKNNNNNCNTSVHLASHKFPSFMLISDLYDHFCVLFVVVFVKKVTFEAPSDQKLTLHYSDVIRCLIGSCVLQCVTDWEQRKLP